MKPDTSKRAYVSRVCVSDTDTLIAHVRHDFSTCPYLGHACPTLSPLCPNSKTRFPLKNAQNCFKSKFSLSFYHLCGEGLKCVCCIDEEDIKNLNV